MHIHKWSKWEVIGQGEIWDRTISTIDPVGKYFTQEKVCQKCGKVKRVKKKY